MDLHNPQRLIMGPWIHANTCDVIIGQRLDTGPEPLRFFDYELKGADNRYVLEPRLTYYTMVEDRWKTSNQSPLATETIKLLYLGTNHSSPKDCSQA